MRKAFVLLTLTVIILAASATAQETYFGKNKVRYKDFDWNFIQTRHFDIYFYEDAYETAKFAAHAAESSYVEISVELEYKIQRRIPLFIYNSHNDFQQTNILPSLIGEGTGGFTEAYKNRMVVPFSGSYEAFRHVLHHELTHAVSFDLIYGNAFSKLVSRQRLFQMPLWLAEGYAEYSSRHGWDYDSDMWMRDATINGYLFPPLYLGGYAAYRQGQAMIKYIADKHGEKKVGELFKKGKVYLSMDRTLKKTIGQNLEEFWEEFSKEMKRRYWPEIAKRKEIAEVGHQLTKSRKDGSYFNEKPVYAPEGDVIAYFTDKWDYTEIVLMSADDGKVVDRIVKGSRSGDLESLHSYVSGISFSPDGRYLVFVAKSKGKESLFFYDMYKRKVTIKKRFDFYNIISPAFSPDGKTVAFSALQGNMRDIFLYNLDDDAVNRLTHDRYDDVDPSWMADGKSLVFCSDRSHPDNVLRHPDVHPYASDGVLMPGGFDYGHYNLFTVDVNALTVDPLLVGAGQNRKPAVSPDGSKIAFISNRNGIDNVYIAYTDSTQAFAVTDILTGVRFLSWSPEGRKLVVEAFYEGAMDIFVLQDLAPVGEDGVLEPTDFVRGTYDHYVRGGDPADAEDTTSSDALTAADPDAVPEESESIPTEEDSTAATELVEAEAAETDSLTVVDTTVVAATEPETTDSTASADAAPQDTATVAEADSTDAPRTGIVDGEFVFVGEGEADPLDEFMADVDDSTTSYKGYGMEEPESFDSIPPPSATGDYEILDYRVKFTPDYVGGGLAYDTFFGLRGQTVFLFSDHLGDHTLLFVTNLVNTIDQSHINAYYFNEVNRTGFGVGLFHSKNFYLDSFDDLFSDRFYGGQLFARHPFTKFSRVEAALSQYFIDREYYDTDDPRLQDRSAKVTTASLGYVTDNIIWGLTGPTNGQRSKITLTAGKDFFASDRDIEFYSAELDYRKYFRLSRNYSFAVRLAAGGSDGATPKTYFLGGTTNWIGNTTLDAEVYDVENLYFADVVTPMRGVDYYSLAGNKYGLMNLEFRYPMIDYFAMRFPLPLVLSRVGGAIFYDMGAAVRKGADFKGGTTEGGRRRLQDIKAGFGFGMRANLGIMLLRYDIAWGTDFFSVTDKPSYYFSFGADF